MLKVRQGTVSLKHRVVELNEDVQKSGGGVADKVSFAPPAPTGVGTTLPFDSSRPDFGPSQMS